jgi:hypothetical protein
MMALVHWAHRPTALQPTFRKTRRTFVMMFLSSESQVGFYEQLVTRAPVRSYLTVAGPPVAPHGIDESRVFGGGNIPP